MNKIEYGTLGKERKPFDIGQYETFLNDLKHATKEKENETVKLENLIKNYKSVNDGMIECRALIIGAILTTIVLPIFIVTQITPSGVSSNVLYYMPVILIGGPTVAMAAGFLTKLAVKKIFESKIAKTANFVQRLEYYGPYNPLYKNQTAEKKA